MTEIMRRPHRLLWLLGLATAGCGDKANPAADGGLDSQRGTPDLAERALGPGDGGGGGSSGGDAVSTGDGGSLGSDGSRDKDDMTTDGGTQDGSGPTGEPGVYYVSPAGSDENPGTREKPFATISHARDVVRQVKGGLDRDVVVNLRGGVHAQKATLVLTSDDSGEGAHAVIYQAFGYGTAQAEKPVLSGGRGITGWTLADAAKKIWKASGGMDLQTRQLYVNGRRARRARSAAGIPGVVARTSSGYTTTDKSLLGWKNPGDIEMIYTGSPSAGSPWTQSRCGVASVTAAGPGTVITMKEPCFTNGTTKKCCGQTIGTPSSIENAYELLTTPGDWYLDRSSGTVYYIPHAGEDMATAVVVAPVVETLLLAGGAPGKPLRNVQLRGITFAEATWLAPSGGDGFIEIQANHLLVGPSASAMTAPGSVVFRTAHNIRLERNTFTRLGAQGLVFERGCQGSTVIGNVFTDISGTGVRIGDVVAPKATGPDRDLGNQVSNNYIHDLPVEYLGGVGLMGGYVAETKLLHNEIARLPYTAISLGWGWGTESYAESNEVAYNHIHHHMQLLADGGGVYTLSEQAASATSGRSTVRGNHIHDQGHEFGGLYHDEGSAYFDTYENVVSMAPRWLHIWTTSIHDIVVRNNFTDTATLTNNGTNITLRDNYTTGLPWPPAARTIIDGAGLEAAYKDLLNP